MQKKAKEQLTFPVKLFLFQTFLDTFSFHKHILGSLEFLLPQQCCYVPEPDSTMLEKSHRPCVGQV